MPVGIVANIRRLFSGGYMAVRYGHPVDVIDLDGVSAAQLYETQPALKTVVDFLARNIAQLPLKVYERDGEDRERDRTGPMAMTLERPSPDSTRYELIRDTVCDLKLYDFALWVVGRDAKSASGWQIRHVPTAWIVASEGDGFAYGRFVFHDGRGQRVEVDADSCVVFHGYSPGDPRDGSSAVRALKETMREQMAAQEFRRATWANSMRITGYISRPASIEPWDEDARSRFAESVRSAWGKGGERAGGTPVFEDGMTYHNVEFSTKEKDWAQGVQLSREEVAAIYHVNPAHIWHSQNQTYASAKDNARALYADTLAPDLAFLQTRITARLAEIMGEEGKYVEFDLQAKLQGSFEEQAASLQSSVGAPWMLVNEARARMNLPRVEGGDDLIVPLNVTKGGLASPRDTDGTRGYNADPVTRVMLLADDAPATCSCDAPAKSAPVEYKAEATEEEADAIADAMSAFFARQRKSVLSAMGAKSDEWWDAARWDRELADDLFAAIKSGSVAAARRALAALGIDPDEYDAARADAFLAAMAKVRAEMVNRATKEQLDAALADEVGEDAERSTPEGVFDQAETSRAKQMGRTLATTVAAWSALEAGRQKAPDTATKTWVTGQNPRASHAKMSGETVPLYAKFSNGADWPGDKDALDAADICGCNCTVMLRIP